MLHTWCGLLYEVKKQLFLQRGTEGLSLIFWFDTQSWPENGFNPTVCLKPQGFGMLRSWFYGYHFPTTEQLLGLRMQFAIFDDAKLEKKIKLSSLEGVKRNACWFFFLPLKKVLLAKCKASHDKSWKNQSLSYFIYYFTPLFESILYDDSFHIITKV